MVTFGKTKEANLISLKELATHIGAQLEDASGDMLVSGIATLMRATPQQISFFSNPFYREELKKTQAAAVILADKEKQYCKVAKLLIDNPYLGYARAATLFSHPISPPPGIHPSAYVSPEAVVDPSASICAHAVIQAGVEIAEHVTVGPGCIVDHQVTIGANSHLVARVTLCQGTRLGKRVLIHPGAVIGSDGFGLANDRGVWIKVPQLGGVLVNDDVEIGANTTIDKGSLEDTFIGQGVKIDNLVQIGHNVTIGDHTAIAGCVGIAGSTRIGRYCMIAGGVGIVGHIELVDYVQVTGGSIVLQSILEPGTYSSGTPLQLNRRWHRNYHRFKQLDDIARRIQTLEHQVK
jgi:UDP-3-O-[3-hydroxymyristoyl] glucosamine N-acyltransferase